MAELTKRTEGTEVSPWHEFGALSDRMRRWADYPFFGTSLFRSPMWAETAAQWWPAVELEEKDDEFLLTAELPGMSKEDIDISIDDALLTVKGEKKVEREEAKGRTHIRERQYGAFERSFTLPRNVEAAKIKADFHDGVVEIHLPKGEKAKGRHIEIKASK